MAASSDLSTTAGTDAYQRSLDAVRDRLDHLDMSPLQIVAVTICVILNMVDGMDVVVLSFAAPVVAQEWGLTADRVGWLFSIGLFGMMIGCLFIAPRADRFGRKPLLLLSLVLITIGMGWVALSHTFWEFAAARLVTGLGVGGILPGLAAVAAEFSNERHRNFSVGIVQAGWPFGAIGTGFLSAWALVAIGWRGLFGIVAGITALMLIAVWKLMPESIEFLAKRQPANALTRLNDVLKKMKREPLASLAPPPPGTHETTSIFRKLLAPGLAGSTIRLWIGVFFAFVVLYTLISWVPSFAKNSGMSLEMAIYAGMALNVGALIGSAAIGPVAGRIGLRKLILSSFIVAVGLMTVYGHAHLGDVATLVLILLIGVTVQGGFNAYYPTAARIYPAELRASGIGYAVGVGRAGAVFGPLIAGEFLAAGVPMSTLFLVFSIPLILSGVAAISIRSSALDVVRHHGVA